MNLKAKQDSSSSKSFDWWYPFLSWCCIPKMDGLFTYNKRSVRRSVDFFCRSDNRLIWFEYQVNERLTIQIFTNKFLLFFFSWEMKKIRDLTFLFCFYLYSCFFNQRISSSCLIPVCAFVTNYLDSFFHSVCALCDRRSVFDLQYSFIWFNRFENTEKNQGERKTY